MSNIIWWIKELRHTHIQYTHKHILCVYTYISQFQCCNVCKSCLHAYVLDFLNLCPSKWQEQLNLMIWMGDQILLTIIQSQILFVPKLSFAAVILHTSLPLPVAASKMKIVVFRMSARCVHGFKTDGVFRVSDSPSPFRDGQAKGQLTTH